MRLDSNVRESQINRDLLLRQAGDVRAATLAARTQGEVMSEQHAALLKKARERLVEDRRDLAKIIAAPFEREKTRDAREKFVDIQAVIEAVDRAIEDEESG